MKKVETKSTAAYRAVTGGLSLKRYCRENGYNYYKIYNRIKRGASFEEAIEGNYHERYRERQTDLPENNLIETVHTYEWFKEISKKQIKELSARYR